MGAGGEGPDTDAAMSKSKRKARKAERASGHSVTDVDRIDLADRFEEGCAQAMAIASLLMEPDADVAVKMQPERFAILSSASETSDGSC